MDGITTLLEDIQGNTPWLAAWPQGEEDTDPPALSDLLAKAAAANCPVTAAFLHRAGAWPFFSSASGGSSALHAALDAGHQGMAELLVRDLGACPYVPDRHAGRLPLHIMADEHRQRMEQVRQAGWLAGRLAGWQVGWLAGRLAGWLAGWLEELCSEALNTIKFSLPQLELLSYGFLEKRCRYITSVTLRCAANLT